MRALVSGTRAIRNVNVGGLHHRPGRMQKMRYVFLSTDEEQEIRDLISSGVKVCAQDVPGARAVPMEEILGVTPPADTNRGSERSA
jgi:PTS system mannose-specific IIB component/fructoselysine and glucoselysine-specific PTS system IIB component